MVSYSEVLEYMTNNKTSIRKTAAHFGITKTIPEKVSKEIGNRKKIFQIDNSVFTELNEHDMYWLGFLYGDGCVNVRTESNMNLELGLKYEDRDHLQKFLNFLKTTDYKVQDREQRLSYADNKVYKSSRIKIGNTNLCKRLIELGCIPNKSLTLSIPEIVYRNINFKHFIRGYIDADGGYLVKESTLNIDRVYLLGTENVLSTIQNYLIENNIINKQELLSKKSNIYNLEFYNHKTCSNIINFIYKNYSESIVDEASYLLRKFNKIKHVL